MKFCVNALKSYLEYLVSSFCKIYSTRFSDLLRRRKALSHILQKGSILFMDHMKPTAMPDAVHVLPVLEIKPVSNAHTQRFQEEEEEEAEKDVRPCFH
jgi:hypothetical protein